MKEKIKKGIERLNLTAIDVATGASCGAATAAVMIFPNAEAIATTGLTSAATNITAEITAALPIAMGVMATIIGVKVAVRFFKSLAK